MPKRRPPLYPPERLAYQVAGRAAVACQYSISIEQVALSCELNPRSVSQFASLAEYCDLTIGDPQDLNRVHHYVQFLMAAQVADMLHHEEAWQIRDLNQRKKFRREWLRQVLEMPTHELDVAYFVIAAWLPVGPVDEVKKVFQRLWKATVQLLETPSYWVRLRRIAARLLDGEPLSPEDIAEVMGFKPE